ncbi:MAG: S41 family peptidase [Acidobacteria bacterium]|nr:S41 family peptidase [Acidobacteriota bacterium]
MRNRLGIILILFSISTAAVLGGFWGGDRTVAADTSPDNREFLRSFTEVLDTVEANYVGDVSFEDLVESGIRGMLRTLDPHSSFFSDRDFNQLQEEQKGKYYGLGISIRSETPGSGRVVIVEPPAPGTPAYKAGLRAGDVIAEIEGEPIDDWDMNTEVIPNLKGPKGTIVNITVHRPGEEAPLLFAVERDEIDIYTIKFAFNLTPDVGYIRIARFAETTGAELDEALDSINEENLKLLILDLRDNPGGALSQALAVSDRFLEKDQIIVRTRSRTGREDRDYKALRPKKKQYAMIVMINQSSASASEIVAGALQDHDRALIVGETSFGKALVQTLFPLEGGRGLALTTGKYYTPSNRLIQRDYSESYFSYFSNHEEDDATADKEAYYTDSGRVVYGGGGINPDVIVKVDNLQKGASRVQGRRLPREFASRIFSGEIPSVLYQQVSKEELETASEKRKQEVAQQVKIDDALMGKFREFVSSRSVSLSEEEWKENDAVLKNFLRQELLLLYVGEEASYKVALELDNQLKEAIARRDEARELIEMHTKKKL